MVELLIMRHAKSDWGSPSLADFDRPLSRRGERAADTMTVWLDSHDLEPDRVVSSAALRARTTAECVVTHFAIDAASFEIREDLYLGSATTWFDAVREQTEPRVLICGHNPGFDDLVKYLSADSATRTADGKLMTTAAIAHFSFDCTWPDIVPDESSLVSLTRPAELDS
ncbi:MAG: histidine phosphatase family protein [Actinobacteria bacterium]|nr:histidine phosphatase family protein [Actinomycetota bacterium]